MTLRRSYPIGMTLACIISAPAGLSVSDVAGLRGVVRNTGLYRQIQDMQAAGLLRVVGRGIRATPLYGITQKGIDYWHDLLRWADDR